MENKITISEIIPPRKVSYSKVWRNLKDVLDRV
jgi:hypothetical protein